MTKAEKPLPNNLDAEKSVLGAILLDNAQLPAAVEQHIGSADFFHVHHSTIYSTMLQMHDAHTPIDLVTLIDSLTSAGKLEAAGGAGYVAQLVDGVPRVGHTAHYCRLVKEKARLRAIIKFSDALQRRAWETRGTGEEIESMETEMRAMMRDSLPPIHTNGNGHYKFGYGLTEFLAAQFPTPEHLIEGLIPKNSTVLVVALPHRLKSWLTTALAIGATKPGTILGCLEVRNPVRTMLVQVEDWPGQTQWRMTELLRTNAFSDPEPDNIRIVPRPGKKDPVTGALLDGPSVGSEQWYARLLQEAIEFKPDLIILDVMRRIFRGDINSPKETAAFLEQIDHIRDATGCTVMLVHHENKKDAEIMTAAAGSYNLPGWANVMIQLKRKTVEGNITHVEIEVDNKLAQSPEPMRMVLDLTSQSPVRVELLEDGVGLTDALDRLGSEWTVRDLAEALDVHKANAYRRLKKWLKSGDVIKVSAGKRGRTGGLARYQRAESSDPDLQPIPIRRIVN